MVEAADKNFLDQSKFHRKNLICLTELSQIDILFTDQADNENYNIIVSETMY